MRSETRHSRHGRLTSIILCGALFCAAGTFETGLQRIGAQQGYFPQSVDVHGNSAVVEAAGEFRVVAANLLWAKVVDHYHHQYLADGGNWATNESLLPLLATIIDLDPHFTQAYALMGGTILPETGKVAQGCSVLQDGIKNNPGDWELYREIAIVYARFGNDPGGGLFYARTGLAVTDDEFSHNLMRRLCRTLQLKVKSKAPAAG